MPLQLGRWTFFVLVALCAVACDSRATAPTLQTALDGDLSMDKGDAEALRKALAGMSLEPSDLVVRQPDTKDPEPAPKAGHVTLKEGRVASVRLLAAPKDLGWFRELRAIEHLHLTKHTLRDFKGMRGCKSTPGLRSIVLQSGKLTSLKGLEGCKKLDSLTVSGNKLEDLRGIEALRSLTTLGATDNRLKSLKALARIDNLVSVSVSGNKLRDLDGLGGKAKLKRIHARNNAISDLGALSKLPALERLDLSKNKIKDPSPLLSLKKLRFLDLRDNAIDAIPKKMTPKRFSELRLEGNPGHDKATKARRDDAKADVERRIVDRPPVGASALGFSKKSCNLSGNCQGTVRSLDGVGRLKLGNMNGKNHISLRFEVKQGRLRAYLGHKGKRFLWAEATPDKPGDLYGRALESGSDKYLILESVEGEVKGIEWETR